MLSKYFSMALAVFVLGTAVQAVYATDVPQIISTDTTWTLANSPYVINVNQTEVASGATLTIEAGVEVHFANDFPFIINGTLIAQGTNNNPIEFKPSNPMGAWVSLRFNESSTDAVFSGNNYVSGSILEHVIIESSGEPAIGNINTSGCIELNSAHPYIHFVTIQNGHSTGISASNVNGVLRIHNSVIQDNIDDDSDEAGGIYIDAEAGSNVEIIGNVIQRNTSLGQAGGISVNNAAVLKIEGNQILNNELLQVNDGAGGVSVDNFSLPGTVTHQIIGNTISGNTSAQDAGGVWFSFTDVNFSNNRLASNLTTSGVGGGMYIGEDTNVMIQSNIISGNESVATGGGIFVLNTVQNAMTISQNIIYDNLSIDNSGGVEVQGGDLTFSQNIVADNVSSGTSASLRLSSAGSVSQNAIVRNDSANTIRINIPINATGTTMDLSQNTIVDNLSTFSVIGSNVSVMANLPTISTNNLWHNGLGYYISQVDPGPELSSAASNYFGTDDSIDIQNNISGLVNYTPFATVAHTDLPMSPPVNVTAQKNGDSVTLNWELPIEADLAGFRVYWKNNRSEDYSLVPGGDVGLATTHTVSGLNASLDYYFAVTAYDGGFNEINNVSSTIINDNQTSGNESWFSEEQYFATSTGGGGGGGSGGGSFGIVFFIALVPLPFLRVWRQH